MLIALTALAQSGKDSFFTIASKILAERGLQSQRFAFADELKKEIDPFLIQHYGFSIFSCTADEKEIARPFMTAHGQARRALSAGRYWIDKIMPEISRSTANVIFITDLRFPNEAEFLREYGATIIHLKKFTSGFLEDREYSYPPNAEEAKNDPILQRMADLKFEWPDCRGNIWNNEEIVREFLNQSVLCY